MTQVRFLQLPKSKVVLDLDNLAGIGQADLNLYVALPRLGNAALQFDGDDKDSLFAWLEGRGLFERAESVKAVVAA